jgi:hypothetical protein
LFSAKAAKISVPKAPSLTHPKKKPKKLSKNSKKPHYHKQILLFREVIPDPLFENHRQVDLKNLKTKPLKVAGLMVITRKRYAAYP